MAAKFYCDICGEEMTPEEHREPRPDRTKIVVPIEGDMCPECVGVFKWLSLQEILKTEIMARRAKAVLSKEAQP